MTTETTARSVPKRPKKAKTAKKAVKPSEPLQLVPGYRGFIALALDSGQIASINVQAVHRNDRFDYAYGLNERLEHVPAEGDRGEITHFYAYAKLKDGGHCFEVLPRAEVDAVRNRSKSWGTGYAEMGKEIAIRRITGYLPLALQKAAALDELGLDELGLDEHGLDELGEIVADFPGTVPEPVPEPVIDAPAEEPPRPTPQAVDLTEEELAGLFPPGHVMRILDAASERDMPDEVLAEIAGASLEEISPEDEPAILRAITSWQR